MTTNEKRFLHSIILLIFNLVCASLYAQTSRPNIVLFIADDLGVTDIGSYGNKSVRTPNLDRLGKESLLFNQAFATAPTCAPSRMSMYTGLFPQKHGAVGNEMGVYNEVSSIVQYFKPLGYKVAIAGKLHVGPQTVFDFEQVKGSNRREPGTEGLKGMFSDLYMDPVGDWLVEQKSDTPFVLIVADHSPHVTWPLKPTYEASEVSVPPQLIDTRQTRELMSRYYTDISKMDKNLGILLQQLKKYNYDKNTLFLFTADQGPQLPFGKWTLYDYGIRVPLMMRLPGKIKAGETTDALVSHVDLLPTLLEVVQGTIPVGIDGKSFYNVLENPESGHRENIYASHSGDKMNNRSVIRMLRTRKYKYILNLTSDDLYSRSNPDDVNVKQIPNDWFEASDKNQKDAATMWRLVHKPREEFYDIKEDPNELVNLANNKDYKETMASFRIQMEALRRGQGDTGSRWKEELNHIPKAPNKKSVAPYSF